MSDGKDTSASSGPAPQAAGAPAAPAAGKGEPSGVSRRLFMWSLPVGWVAFAAACTAGLIATARSLFPNVLFEPPQSFKAGFPGEYNVGRWTSLGRSSPRWAWWR